MKKILSIQSHVAYGYVGNKAAVFPLQRMGFDVSSINTVQFSNHTGYGYWGGDVLEADHIRRVVDGLDRLGALDQFDALLTGYAGSQDICQVLLSTYQRMKPDAIWVCDPVMGDVERGFFVKEGIPEFFKNEGTLSAKVMTPNFFELEYLTGTHISSPAEIKGACRVLHDKGVQVVLVTSVMADNAASPSSISMVLSHVDGETYIVDTPYLPIIPAPNGAGDCTAAILAGLILDGLPLKDVLGQLAARIYGIFTATHLAGTRELALIKGQNEIVNPTHNFPVRSL